MGVEQRPIAIVTGASGGIGFQFALGLARRGWQVHALSRPEGRGEAAASEIGREVGRADAVTFLPVDLASFSEVRQAAARLALVTARLDLLMLNAGAYGSRYATTEDGYERTFALNHLSPFLLTHLLTPALQEADAPRLVVTSSGAHAMAGAIDPVRAASGVPYSAWRAYGWSKLANVLFAREAVRRAPHPALRAYAYHPGFVASGFGTGSGVTMAAFRLGQRLFGRSNAAGADTGLWLATAEPPPEPNGGYFTDRERKRPAAPGLDDAQAAELWRRSEAWVDLPEDLRWPAPE
ncbi:MAG: SDR family NAD(P)-dependent oxidoreductase [Trueperaceae bacterium]